MSTPGTLTDVDLIILGGGCAGLSLATLLAHARTALRVIIVEPRIAYHEDRTWCGWRLTPHAFADCAVASWKSWQVTNSGRVIERSSNLYPYEMIRSDLFYEKACQAIAGHASMSLLRGLSADILCESSEMVEVTLSDGSKLSAPWVIDTRPVQRTMKRPWLWQNFVGFAVEFDGAPCARFNRTPVLMDFQDPGTCAVQFMYILPVADREFLCEWTQFAAEPGHLEEIEANLRGWLREHAGSSWTIRRQEQGSLPMAVLPAAATSRVILAGTQGGSMRASTGYAFHSIQRWAEACCASLLETGVPHPPHRNGLLERMDAIFLEVLQDPSTSAMEIFCCLFEKSPPDSLVRFLAGMPRHSDLWPVMRSLPWTRFLRAAPSALRSSGRSPRTLLAGRPTAFRLHSRNRT